MMQKLDSDWNGKKVAFLGDSITDAIHVGTAKNYWQFLEEMLGIKACVYGVNGAQWTGVAGQAIKLQKEMGNEVDAIFIFAGTNDYNHGVPIGEWWRCEEEATRMNEFHVTRQRRHFIEDIDTFRGRIARTLNFLKAEFPLQQIVLMTPIHRGFAVFSDANVQPDETFPNRTNLYIENYINVLREAADIWSLPLIDLFRDCGLFPNQDSHAQFFHDGKTDRLHPNAAGHFRMAKTMAAKMLTIPSDFKDCIGL